MTVERMRQHAAHLLTCAETRERNTGTDNAAAALRLRRLAGAMRKAADQAETLQQRLSPLRQQAAAAHAEALNLQRWRPRG